MKRRFAVFDIDGTVFRSQLYHELVLSLPQASPAIKAALEAAKQNYEDWRNRHNSFEAYDRALVDGVEAVLQSNITPAEFDAAVEQFVAAAKDRTYVYTRDLIKSLKKQGYIILAISGSYHEAVEQFALHHGFDDWIGYRMKRSPDGTKFVEGHHGKTHKDKHLLLQQFVEKHNLTYAGSYGVGDSAGDASMLELVEHPIAFNPTKELLEHAKQHHWTIVVERKSLAYRLEYSDGSYVLA